MTVFHCEHLLQRNGWQSDVFVSIDQLGRITKLATERPDGPVKALTGPVLPGFANSHSHAFQYAMAGLAEHLPSGAKGDDFWGWREAMYRLALRITPPQLEAVASQLYAQMLRHGYTSVVEFHYVHHDSEGRPYQHLAEMSERLVAAAATTGIHLTLIPILYRLGGFGRPAGPAQRRFLSSSMTAYQHLLESVRALAGGRHDVLVGLGVHSLRAVAKEEVLELLGGNFQGPAHLHIAEQLQEVNDCVAYLGARPVRWLLDNLPLDHRFNLVHATHVDEQELTGLAQSDATVVLCPSTEGNLGDGLFPYRRYLELGGRVSIGSDSQITLSPMEELRWLDYGQRLTTHQRATVARREHEDSGNLGFTWAWERGQLAAGLPDGEFFAVGRPFDGLVLDRAHPALVAKPQERWLAALIYAGDPTMIAATFRRGRMLVERGVHCAGRGLSERYSAAMNTLMAT